MVKQQWIVAFIYLACQANIVFVFVDFLFVCFYREGSVIADMELIFEQEVGASEVDALLSEAAKDGNIGGIKVDQIKSDGVIKGQLLLH